MNKTFENIPKKWLLATIDQVADIDSNLVNPANFQHYPHIAPNHIESGTGRLLEYTTVAKDAVTSSKHLFFPGHIIYSKIRPYLAKAVLIDFEGLCSADMYPMRAYISSAYLHRWLISGEFTHLVSRTQGRTVLPKVNQSALKKINIPLPPLNEQHRIVTKIEALTARSRKAREALDAIPALLDQFRQSVLAAAFRGDLTADWREQNPDVEPAEKLLERIREERLSQTNSLKQKDKVIEIYESTESDDSNDLPNTWQFVFLEKLTSSLNYGTSSKSLASGKIPVLRMGNMQKGEIDWSSLAYTSDDKDIEKYKLEPYTVLFNRTNSPELVGKTSIYRGEKKAIFAGYLIRINHLPQLDPEYLNYFLNSPYAQSICWQCKTDGVSQSNINAQKLGRYEIPFCSPKEQKEIVKRINQLFKKISLTKNYCKQNNLEINQLDQSILAKAFRGELVPQDPTDEPATVLLQRIQAEREELKAKSKDKGKSSAKKKK